MMCYCKPQTASGRTRNCVCVWGGGIEGQNAGGGGHRNKKNCQKWLLGHFILFNWGKGGQESAPMSPLGAVTGKLQKKVDISAYHTSNLAFQTTHSDMITYRN